MHQKIKKIKKIKTIQTKDWKDCKNLKRLSDYCIEQKKKKTENKKTEEKRQKCPTLPKAARIKIAWKWRKPQF